MSVLPVLAGEAAGLGNGEGTSLEASAIGAPEPAISVIGTLFVDL